MVAREPNSRIKLSNVCTLICQFIVLQQFDASTVLMNNSPVNGRQKLLVKNLTGQIPEQAYPGIFNVFYLAPFNALR